VRVADIDKAVEKIRDLGGQLLYDPMEVPGGDRVVACLDPQGARFAIHEVRSV
jgi:predicted enzyme related to lactoylglutathione lyase